MSPSLGKINRKFNRLPKDAFAYWRKITPKRTGNAKRKTKLVGDTIQANYKYAVPLDQGRSKQAPQGMSAPTEKYIARLIKGKILRK